MNDDNEDIYKVDDEDEYVVKSDDKEELKTKLIRYGIIAFVCLIIFILLVAIFFPKGNKKENVVSKDLTLKMGEKYSLDYSRGNYTWTSSDSSIAKVSDNGEIVALKSGDTTITIKSGKETVTYKIHIDKVDDSLLVTNVKMESNTIELEKNKTYDMKVTFTPSTVSNIELTWFSSDEKVATVNNGIITAVAPGSCVVTVKTANGNIDNCLVKVLGDGNYNPVEEIKINSTDVSLNKGTSYNISYEVVPSESANLITWVSSNKEVATVENGIIYALAGGETQISAKSGDIVRTITIKVNGGVVEPKVVLNNNNIGLKIGQSYNLSVKNNVSVTWKTSNANVAVVDDNGTVVGIAAGQALITATSSDGETDECTVTVSTDTAGDKVTLQPSTLSLSIGEKASITEVVTPSNNLNGTVWSSSDPKIATVNNGEVTAVANGTATITATLPNGAKATCVVTVAEKVVNAALVQLNATSLTLEVNKSSQLTATILPSNATNKTIKWSSSNTEVATVDSNGKVTAKKKGSAKIYARAANGVFNVCAVYVK